MQGSKADIDPQQILELAARLWRPKEIAAFFKVSVRTIYNYVSAEELEEARELGKGNLIDIAWERARQGSDKILIHMLQYHRDEVPVQRAKLADTTNDDLYEEVQRRIAASGVILSGQDWRRKAGREVKRLPEDAKVVDNAEATASTEVYAVGKKGTEDPA